MASASITTSPDPTPTAQLHHPRTRNPPMSLLPFLNWLGNLSWAIGLKQSALLFPLVEGSHILSLSLSVGMIMVMDFRLLRLSFRTQPASLIYRQLLPWAAAGFCIAFFTGALLFSTDPLHAC